MKKCFSKNISFCLTSFFVSFFIFITGLFIPSISASAFTSSDINSAIVIGELWNNDVYMFNGDNVNKLLQLVSNDENTNVFNLSTILSQAEEKKTAEQIRESENASLNKESGQDIIVTLGGLDFTVTYLSTDEDGNAILTLWLANSYQLKGKTYFGTSVFDDEGRVRWCFTSMNASASSSPATSNFPDNMYGTSYMRSVILNNGGLYNTSNNGTYQDTATKQSNSVFSPFTYSKEGEFNDLTDFIVTPEKVSWQKNQSFTAQFDSSVNNYFNRSNEAWDKETGDEGFNSSDNNYASRDYSDAWKTDRLWLPSLTETGYKISKTVDGVTTSNMNAGIWGASEEQLKNGVNSWLRSASYNNGYQVTYIGGTTLSNTNVTVSNGSQGVRPALHLNINDMIEHTTTQKDIGACVVDPLAPQQWNPVENVIPEIVVKDTSFNFQPVKDVDYTIKVPDITRPGTYEIQIVGKEDGRYQGTKIVTLEITKRSIELALKDNDLNLDDRGYTSFEIEPVFNDLRDYAYQPPDLDNKGSETGIELVQNSHYVLSYKDNINLGKATITITGYGDFYTGSVTTNFNIIRASITKGNLTVDKEEVEYYFDENVLTTVSIELSLNGLKLVEGRDYDLFYYNKEDYTEGGENSNLDSIFEIGDYLIVAVGKGNYIDSVKTPFKVTQATLKDNYIVLDKTSYTYTGSQIIPNFEVKFNFVGDKVFTFSEGTDYTSEFGENILVSTGGTIVIKGQGKFKGQASATFNIEQTSLSGSDILVTFSDDLDIENLIFNNSEQKVTIVSIKIGGIEFYQFSEDDTIIEPLEIKYYRGESLTTDFISSGVITIKIVSSSNQNIIGEYVTDYTIKQKNLLIALENDDLIFSGFDDKVYNRNQHTLAINIVDKNASNYQLANNEFSFSVDSDCIEVEQDIKVTITGTNGNYTGTIIQTFNIVKAVVNSFELTKNNSDYSESEITIPVVVKAGSLVLNTSEYKIVTKRNGVINDDLTSAGSISIILELIDTKNFEFDETLNKELTYNINSANISSVTLVEDEVYFNNTEHTIQIKSVESENGLALKASDYTVKYNNTDNYSYKDAGEVEVSVTGIGNFTGTITVKFTIKPRAILSNEVKYFIADSEGNKSDTLIDFNGKYKGDYVLPFVSITDNNGYDLILGTDYSFEIYTKTDYSGNKTNNLFGTSSYLNVGEYVFVLNGINNFSETITKNYVVNLADFNSLTIEVTIPEVVDYTGNPITFDFDNNEVLVKYTKPDSVTLSLILGTDFKLFNGYIEVTYKGDTNNIESVRVLPKSEINDKKDNDNVFNVVNGYANNTNAGIAIFAICGALPNFENDTVVVKQFTISQISFDSENLEITNLEEKYTFTGSSIVPEISVKSTVTNRNLILNEDYKITFTSDNLNVGNVSFVISGINSYTGDVTYNNAFKIEQKTLSQDMFTIPLEAEFTGEELKPTITAVFNDYVLLEGTSYTVVYKRNGVVADEFVSRGDITIELTGMGNFEGTITKTYTIKKASFTKATISLSQSSKVFTGEALSTTVTIKLGEKTIDSSNYDISYLLDNVEVEEMINVNTYTIKVTGKGDYTDSISTTFNITAFDISNTTVNEYTSLFSYNKETQKPVITLNYGLLTLENNSDFTTQYYLGSLTGNLVENPIDAGTYFIVLKGKGNYTGTLNSLSFIIKEINLNSEETLVTFDNTLNSDDLTFNNTKQKAEVTSVKIGEVELYNVSDNINYLNVTYLRGSSVTSDFISAGSIIIKITSTNENNIVGEFVKTYTIKQKELETAFTNDVLNIEGLEDRTYNREVQTFTISLLDTQANYTLVENKDYSINYETDCIQAKENIKVTFTASTGNYTGSIIQTFSIKKAIVDSFSLKENNGVYSNNNHVIVEEIYAGSLQLNSGTDFSAVYERNGTVTTNLKDHGEINVRFILLDNKNFELSSSLVSVNVYTITKAIISSVTLVDDIVTFDTEEHVIEINKVLSKNGLTLTSEDYQVTYNDTDIATFINAGNVEVKVSGKGNFTGESITTFTIKARTISSDEISYYVANSDGSASSTLLNLNDFYLGKFVAPVISISEGSYNLVINKDFIFAIYSLEDYEGQKNSNLFGTNAYLEAGSYVFEVLGTGNFTGSVSQEYIVNAANFNMSTIDITIPTSFDFTGDPIEIDFSSDEVIIKYTKSSLDESLNLVLNRDFTLYSGYIEIIFDSETKQIQSIKILSASEYENKKDQENVFKVENGYVNNFTAGTAHLVIKGKSPNYQSNTVVVKSFEINQISLDVEITNIEKEYVYTGYEIIPEIIIKSNTTNKYLVENEDYEITYTNNLNVGLASFVIKGINGYEGTVTRNNAFSIIQRTLSHDLFTISEDTVYNTEVQKPEILAKLNGKILEQENDYLVTFKRNNAVTSDFTNAGNITIQIEGIGNFTGTIIKNYQISKWLIKEIVLDKELTTFNGSDQTPSIKVVDNLGQDVNVNGYELTYSKKDFINAGNILISVTLKDNENYGLESSQVSKTFVINKEALNKTQPNIQNQIYSGLSLEPRFTLKLGDYTVNSNEYTITNYTNNLNVGTGYIIVSSTNLNFEGNIEIPFNIEAKPLEEDMLYVLPKNLVYNGSQIELDFTLTFNSIQLVNGVDYLCEYQNNINANSNDSAILIITGSNNFTGTLSKNFSIDKANPVVKIKCKPEVLFIDDNLTDIHYLQLDEGSTKGTLTNSILTDLILTNNVQWSFVPDDTRNYNELSGSEKVQAYYCARVVFDDTSNVLAGEKTNVSAKVEVRRNGEFHEAPASFEMIITCNGKVVDSFVESGIYNIKINLLRDDYYLINDDNITFSVKATTVFSENNSFYAYCENGFDTNVVLSIQTLSDKEDIINLIGEDNYNKVPNILKVFTVKFLRGSQETYIENAKIYFNASQNTYHLLNNNELVAIQVVDNKIEIISGSFLIESSNPTNNMLLIVIAIIVFIILIFVLIIIGNRKKKKKKAILNTNTPNINNKQNVTPAYTGNINPNTVINNVKSTNGVPPNVRMQNVNMPNQNFVGQNNNIQNATNMNINNNLNNGKNFNQNNVGPLPNNSYQNGNINSSVNQNINRYVYPTNQNANNTNTFVNVNNNQQLMSNKSSNNLNASLNNINGQNTNMQRLQNMANINNNYNSNFVGKNNLNSVNNNLNSVKPNVPNNSNINNNQIIPNGLNRVNTSFNNNGLNQNSSNMGVNRLNPNPNGGNINNANLNNFGVTNNINRPLNYTNSSINPSSMFGIPSSKQGATQKNNNVGLSNGINGQTNKIVNPLNNAIRPNSPYNNLGQNNNSNTIKPNQNPNNKN